MLGPDGILEIRPGLHVIAVPTVWKVEGKDGGSGCTADEVCTHVAKQLFGEDAELYEPDTLAATLLLYAEVVDALTKVCEDNNRKFEVVNPIDMVCHIGGPTWKEAGLRWIRVVRIEKDMTA